MNERTLYEIARRDRDQAAMHHRLSLGMGMLVQLSLLRPELSRTKDLNMLMREIGAIRRWSDMVRLQETRIRLHETTWLEPILAQVRAGLHAAPSPHSAHR